MTTIATLITVGVVPRRLRRAYLVLRRALWTRYRLLVEPYQVRLCVLREGISATQCQPKVVNSLCRRAINDDQQDPTGIPSRAQRRPERPGSGVQRQDVSALTARPSELCGIIGQSGAKPQKVHQSDFDHLDHTGSDPG